ncbi:MAG TPA: polysaccharide biosynthesis tyrosine autokinase [Candidatus Eisenbacteria bacterium]|nr:polysaccharide biosynthesis tyrosine autokinase [Candidatus Eisenbacteria bacterium]
MNPINGTSARNNGNGANGNAANGNGGGYANTGAPGTGLMVRDRDAALSEYAFGRDAALVEYFANPPRQNPATMRDVLKVLFRQKGVIFATILAVCGTVFAGLKMQTPEYEAHVKMLILAEKQLESPYYRDLEGSFKTEMALTQSEIVKANPVLERAVKSLKLDERPLDYEREFASPLKQTVLDLKMQMIQKKIRSAEQEKFMRFKVALESLRENIKVKPVSNTNLFTISVKDFSPIAAATIANTISRYYVIFDLEQQLAELQIKYGEKHLAVKQLEDHIRDVERTLTEKSNSYIDTMGPASVKILEQASMPTDPVGLPKFLVMLAAFFASVFLGVMLAFVFESMDPTFRSPEDVERALNMPLLGSIPRRKFGSRLLTKEPAIHTKYSQSFQRLADQMHIVMRSRGLQTVVISSSIGSEGTTTVAVNLASYLSRHLKHKVLIVDANLRNPSVHRAFKIPNNFGLSEVLEGRTPLESAIWEMTPELGVLPAGKSKTNPLTLLDSQAMADFAARAKEKYEFILIDCANLKHFRDTEILAGAIDGVAVVVEAGHARRQAVKACIAPLEQKKANLMGAILNKRSFALPKVIYDRV